MQNKVTSVETISPSPAIIAPGIIAPWKRELAAVCCHFNPCRYQSRLRNYHIFRTALMKTGMRLLTVELALGAQDWELNNVADVLRVRASDVLWHKERLLNLGIAQLLGEGFTKIAWLDADIVFHDPAWPQKLSAFLDRCVLCQAFTDAARQEKRDGRALILPGSMHYLHRHGAFGEGLTGLAWAARAELLKALPLYDVCLVGGGDLAICFGACYSSRNNNAENFFDDICRILGTTPLRKEHFRRWATPFGALVDGRIGFIEGTVETLYHGSVQNRRYGTRYEVLGDFDPDRDIAYNEDGCWRWSSAKPHLHEAVREYFLSRREDD